MESVWESVWYVDTNPRVYYYLISLRDDMASKRSRKLEIIKKSFVATLLIVAILTMSTPATAQGPNPINGSLAPNSKLPDATDLLYQQKLNQVKRNQIQAANVLREVLYVGTLGQFREPDEAAYVNYCGPSSTQIALRARTTEIPELDEIAKCEQINPLWGVYMTSVTDCLNQYLDSDHYWTDIAESKEELSSWLKTDIDQGYALVTGVYTTYMRGWNGYSIAHIITIYGYDYSNQVFSDKMVYYSDTASKLAGYSGPYFNIVTLDDVWSFISWNNVQSW